MANVEHSVLTGSDLHEPKGIAAAAANRVYVSNGAASGSWTTVPASAITAAGVLVFQGQMYHVRDERSSGTAGDSLTHNTWNTRTLQTEVTDDLTLTITSNQISLAAGTYLILAYAQTAFTGLPTHNSGQSIASKLRIRNITDSTTIANGIGQKFSLLDDGGGNDMSINKTLYTSLVQRVVLAGTKTIELQNWVFNNHPTPTIKTGVALSTGENEVYSDLIIWKTA